MRIEKNVCESIVGTLLHIKGKSKDGLNCRKDLKELGIRHDLCITEEKGKKTKLPPALHNFSKAEKHIFCKRLFDMKAEIKTPCKTNVGQPSPVTPRPSEQLGGTEGLPSFRSPKKAETYVGQHSPVTPRPSEQLAGTEGLPSFRSPKKAETYVGQHSPMTPRPSKPLAGTEGLSSFRYPKKVEIKSPYPTLVGQPSPVTPRP
ncbi:hypothetical protein ACFX2G_026332 [Malus domestica]|nr:proteoglycan 4-like [Malus domestica]